MDRRSTPSRSCPAKSSATVSIERIRVLVDVEDYRKRRAERVVEKAKAAADAALDTGQEQALEPMDALERKIAHDAVAEIDGVTTESRGEDPDRHVVVLPD